MRTCLLLVTVLGAALSSAGPRPQGAGICQLIESRNGKTACWGVVTQLDKRVFKKTIDQDELSIVDAKHGSEMKDIMRWSVDKTGRKLLITFKQGCGDFGSGNAVTISIKDGAFKTPWNQDVTFSISTDEL